MTYDVDYFIAKFEAIPDDKWTIGAYVDENGCCCALGHCGQRKDIFGFTEEAECLTDIFLKHLFCSVIYFNDNHMGSSIESPKQRVLFALYDIKTRTK